MSINWFDIWYFILNEIEERQSIGLEQERRKNWNFCNWMFDPSYNDSLERVRSDYYICVSRHANRVGQRQDARQWPVLSSKAVHVSVVQKYDRLCIVTQVIIIIQTFQEYNPHKVSVWGIKCWSGTRYYLANYDKL